MERNPTMNKDEMLANAIRESHKIIHENIVGNEAFDNIRNVATTMLEALLEELGDLGPEVLTDQSWVAGFTSGIATAGMLTTLDDVRLEERPCPDGMNHTHYSLDSDQLLGYLDTACYGIIEGHLMYGALKEITDGINE
jgi:hypothetical protein